MDSGMARPAIFFDRDNTLIASDEYLGDPAQVKLIAGAADAVARAQELGFARVIFSNQSGVARGMFPESAVHAVNARLDEMLRAANPKATIDRHEFCPFHPDGSIEAYRQESPLRKPAPGMILRAAEALGLDLARSWVIGDAPRDIEAGHAAGCRTILFCDPNLPASPAARSDSAISPDYRVSTLKEAMEKIEEATPNATTAPASSEPPISPDPAGAATPLVSTLTIPTLAGSIPPATAPAEVEVKTKSATDKLESIASEILRELRRQAQRDLDEEFSISKLLAGIVQMVVVLTLFLAFWYRGNPPLVLSTLVFALTLQTMTIALLIMGRQK
jgi:D-glycero-D-manno-heptose 1,7-bisphosphate phosphatase